MYIVPSTIVCEHNLLLTCALMINSSLNAGDGQSSEPFPGIQLPSYSRTKRLGQRVSRHEARIQRAGL